MKLLIQFPISKPTVGNVVHNNIRFASAINLRILELRMEFARMEFAHFGICAFWNLRMEFAHGICAWNLRMEFAHFGIAHGICAWNLRILELRMEFAHGICAI